MLVQYFWSGFSSGCLILLVSVGFCIVYRDTGIFYIPQACIFVMSGYVTFLQMSDLGVSLPLAATVSVFLSVILGILTFSAVYGPLISRGANWNVLFVTSIGLYAFLSNLFSLLWGNSSRYLYSGSRVVWRLSILSVSALQVAGVVLCFLMCLGLWWFLTKTTAGMTIRAVGDNPALSAALGFNVTSARITVFAVSSAFAGAAGVISFLDVGVSSQSGMTPVLNAAIAVMAAGRRSLVGTAIAALVLGLLQAFSVMLWSARWQQISTLGALALLLLVRNRGIVIAQERAEEA